MSALPAEPDLPRGEPSGSAAPQRYWRRARAVTLGLLLAWGGVTFGAIWFARELDFTFFGWPFAYWLAAQGALLIYLALIAVYAAVMNALDRRYAASNGAQADRSA